MTRRIRPAVSGYRWSRRALIAYREQVRQDGLSVQLLAPPTVARGSLRGVLTALRRDRATCLERSLIIQRWFASKGVALDVVVGVRSPSAAAAAAASTSSDDGATAHAWVEQWDADCSDRFAEIRRIPAPEGVPSAGSGR